ncbi:MAG: acyltransferase [Winogradskyella sp.]|uniref:acyltransferase family protein n=1 Tax=Winogradskyella sp. TaxID=1883156 RepID=UPI0038580ED5
MKIKKRRYDIDWLRVIAILAVFLHHIGMPFNGDKFHIMNLESSKVLDDMMVFFEQFRLPLLFLISGIGTMFAFSKRTSFEFIKERSKRLLIPLFFGILIIIPPQTYFEHKANFTSYADVYRNFSFDVNHLWFIENLFLMSIFFIPLILVLKSSKSDSFIKRFERLSSKKIGLFLGVLPLLLINVYLKKHYASDSKDITNLSSTFYYSYFFVSGMLFASSSHIWNNLKTHRKFNASVFLISSALFYSYYFMPNSIIAPYLSVETRWSLWYALCALLGWTFVIALLGYGQLWFDKNSNLLQRCNEAIYPFYILHQTLIVVVGYYIVQLELGIPIKLLLLLSITFILTLTIYRVFIYPFRITRLLFGMKKKD